MSSAPAVNSWLPQWGGVVSGQDWAIRGRCTQPSARSAISLIFFSCSTSCTIKDFNWEQDSGNVCSNVWVCVHVQECSCMRETLLQGHRAQGGRQRLMMGGDKSLSILREESSVMVWTAGGWARKSESPEEPQQRQDWHFPVVVTPHAAIN